MNVGHLREAMKDLPDDAEIHAQIYYAFENSWWNVPIKCVGEIELARPRAFTIQLIIPEWIKINSISEVETQ